MFERTKQFFSGLFASTPLPTDPAPAPDPRAALRGTVAFVDPSRSIAANMFTPYNPSQLVTRKGLSIFDEMKRDEQVKTALQFKKDAILAPGWEIVSPGDQEEDWEVTQFVRDALEHIEGGMEDALRKIMLAFDYGYSVTEKIFKDNTLDTSRLEIAKMTSIKPHYIDIAADPYGNIITLLQRYGRIGSPSVRPGGINIGAGTPLPVEKFVLYSHQQEFENHYGRSELEAAYRAWWAKDNAYKWMTVMLERFGMPPLFLLYDSNAYDDGEVEKLKRAIVGFQNGTLGVIPRTSKEALEFYSQNLTAGNTRDVFLAALNRYDQDIAKALLMPSLIGGTTDGEQQKGSMARANVHERTFLATIRFEQRNLARKAVDSQIIRPLCDLNYPGLTSYPMMRFLDPDNETKVALYTEWRNMVKDRVVNQIEDDERHLRKAFGMPENDDPTVPDRNAEAAALGGRLGGLGKPDPSQEEKDPKPATAEELAQYSRDHGSIEDYTLLTSDLDALEEKSLKALREVVVEMRDALIATVTKAHAGGNLNKIVNQIQLRKRGDLQSAIQETLRRAWEKGQKDAGRLVRKAKNYQTYTGKKAPQTSFVPRAALKWLSARGLQVSGIISEKLLGDAKNVLLNAVKVGKPISDTIDQLTDVFEPYVGNPHIIKDGSAITPFRLETVVRTNTTEAYNHGRLTQFRNPDLAPFMIGVMYNAIMDQRTTEVCAFLDGKIFKANSADVESLLPPNHFNCRSIVTPLVVGEEVDENDFITPAEIGKAKMLADAKFLAETGEHRHTHKDDDE